MIPIHCWLYRPLQGIHPCRFHTFKNPPNFWALTLPDPAQFPSPGDLLRGADFQGPGPSRLRCGCPGCAARGLGLCCGLAEVHRRQRGALRGPAWRPGAPGGWAAGRGAAGAAVDGLRLGGGRGWGDLNTFEPTRHGRHGEWGRTA